VIRARGWLATLHTASLAVAIAAWCSCVAPSHGSEAAPPAVELFVLGIAQDGGLPHFGCSRECCERARREGRTLSPACLGVVDHTSGSLLVVEATPQVEAQTARLHRLAGVDARGRRPVDAVLLTHAHMGHYLGLAHFGREVASTDRLPVHASPRMAAFLREHAPWKQLVELGQIDVVEHAPRNAFAPMQGVSVTAIPVPHRDEFSDTMAYVLRGPRKSVLFVPDVDRWDGNEALLDELLHDVDVAYVDGTFYDGRELPERNLAEIRHPLMTDTMHRLSERAKARPGSVRFLHLNHTNPALHDAALRRAIEARGFAIAAEGERVAM
jgi:pyrroloquinoline quinone biosynthesis protein B